MYRCYCFSLGSCDLQNYLDNFYLLRQFCSKISGTSQRSWRYKKEFPLFHLSCSTSGTPLFHKCLIWRVVLICSHAVGAHRSLMSAPETSVRTVPRATKMSLSSPLSSITSDLVHRSVRCPKSYSSTQLFFSAHLLSQVSFLFHLLPFLSFFLVRTMFILVIFLSVVFLITAAAQNGLGCCLALFASNTLLSSILLCDHLVFPLSPSEHLICN